MPENFYNTDRMKAELVWFRQGTLEYRFRAVPANIHADWLELSFEACSEAPMHRDPWKSDIFVELNGVRLGVWTSPMDCGGRRGDLTPNWWSDVNTQFGFLKTWRVTPEGTYLDGEPISDVTLSDLRLGEHSCTTFRIGVDANAENVGGLNLFGEHFGDHPQPIVIRIGYHFE